jgi:glycosyltransferase involved in cell wall biosynthesis
MIESLVYLVPVHNEEPILPETIRALHERRPPGLDEVILIENGSRDRSLEVAREATAGITSPRFVVETVPEAGLGHALFRGLESALRRHRGDSAWLVMTAADLPFGFTDLDAFRAPQALAERVRGARLFIGSKAHPRTIGRPRGARGLASIGYWIARRAIVGMRTRDSQGSLFIRADLAADILHHLRSRDFFFSTEVVCIAERLGERVVELPVAMEPERRRSTVRIVRHSVRMFRQLVELRRRAPWDAIAATRRSPSTSTGSLSRPRIHT